MRSGQACNQDGYADSKERTTDNLFYDSQLDAYRIHGLLPG
jgi:hypothetical protein